MYKIFLLIFLLPTSCSTSRKSGSGFSFQLREMNYLENQSLSGDAESQYALGSSYCCGSKKVDYIKATKWLCQAAKQGHIGAQKKVALIHSQRAVAQIRKKRTDHLYHNSNILALTWYKIVSNNGDKTVDPYIREIALYLSWQDARKADYYIGNYPNIPCEVKL